VWVTTLADLTIEHSDGEELAGSVVLRVTGTLGATTYHQLRDAIIKAVPHVAQRADRQGQDGVGLHPRD
jgi:hypothetical protein